MSKNVASSIIQPLWYDFKINFFCSSPAFLPPYSHKTIKGIESILQMKVLEVFLSLFDPDYRFTLNPWPLF